MELLEKNLTEKRGIRRFLRQTAGCPLMTVMVVVVVVVVVTEAPIFTRDTDHIS